MYVDSGYKNPQIYLSVFSLITDPKLLICRIIPQASTYGVLWLPCARNLRLSIAQDVPAGIRVVSNKIARRERVRQIKRP
jgi:hypothetical protein